MPENQDVNRLHYLIIRNLIDKGACPTNPQLAADLHIAETQVEQLLRSLADIHGVVLHPHSCTPWVIHPFSITPTLNWIEGDRGGWWAPCIWCALGIAALVPGELRIHTRIGAQSESLIVEVLNGQVISPGNIWVHFAVPPAHAWDNVHQHCAMVLPFHHLTDIETWSEKHGLPQGEAVPLRQVALLARNWYGTHANANWRKWTIDEAQEIFHQSGFTSKFWDLGAREGKF